MLDNILPTLRKGPETYSRTIICSLGEGNIAEGIKNIQMKFSNVDIGCYPHFKAGNFGVSIVIRSLDMKNLKIVLEKIRKLILRLGDQPQLI